MFTGLIADLGQIRDVRADADGARLEVQSALAAELAEGDSVALDGVCLTATRVGDLGFSADAMHETLARSTLGRLGPGDTVNLELALRAADRLGGHLVQGHVDGVGSVARVDPDGLALVMRISADAGLLRYVVEKGSIAVSGVSLTVSGVHTDRLEVSLIPETLARTTLGSLKPGDQVNLEVDVLAKYVERLAAPAAGARA